MKKQACLYRLCSWKNPGGTPRGRGRGGARRAALATPSGTPVSPKTMRQAASAAKAKAEREEDEAKAKKEKPASGGGGRRGRQSLPVVSPAAKPPAIVKKGDEEYMVVVSGVDTGLSGKYWADMEALPPRRSRKSVQQAKEVKYFCNQHVILAFPRLKISMQSIDPPSHILKVAIFHPT